MNGDDGIEFVEFPEGPTKTRPGGLSAKPSQFQPKMFQTGEGNFQLLLIFRQYISVKITCESSPGISLVFI